MRTNEYKEGITDGFITEREKKENCDMSHVSNSLYKKHTKDVMCSICMEDIDEISTEKHRSKKLNCGHFFHSACLIPWLQKSNSCPNCRRLIVRKRNSNSNKKCRSTQSNISSLSNYNQFLYSSDYINEDEEFRDAVFYSNLITISFAIAFPIVLGCAFLICIYNFSRRGFFMLFDLSAFDQPIDL
ncbi:MAG: putative E3 ubiquitin-protein ligase RNF12-B-like [Sylvanvirus sp.]|uniref:Putative E3 ubiquitin-protein ligase RNF12-B-like n=1 Tax=Sylvanvirus sp. TaxID=2487774 RepID=A0A3G5AIA6_9VIRU|nr:MAG: putative E3 ubiquitin-protein ligase RNF12-B-like [Sylvanvirus sp.]